MATGCCSSKAINSHQENCTFPESWLEQIAEQGLNILPELVRIVINTAMQAEREQYLGALVYVPIMAR